MYVCMYIYMYVCNGFTSEVYKFAYPAAMSSLHGKEEDNGDFKKTYCMAEKLWKTTEDVCGLVAE